MLSDAINRWRHRRGFGVHSPAAFMLVKEVVRPHRRYRYYAEDRVDVMRVDETDRKLCRLAVRLIGYLHPESLTVGADSPLVPLLKKEGIPYSCQPKPSGSDPFLTLAFKASGHQGEARLFRAMAKSEIEQLLDEAQETLVIEGRRFVIEYKVPGLTSLHVTV